MSAPMNIPSTDTILANQVLDICRSANSMMDVNARRAVSSMYLMTDVSYVLQRGITGYDLMHGCDPAFSNLYNRLMTQTGRDKLYRHLTVSDNTRFISGSSTNTRHVSTPFSIACLPEWSEWKKGLLPFDSNAFHAAMDESMLGGERWSHPPGLYSSGDKVVWVGPSNDHVVFIDNIGRITEYLNIYRPTWSGGCHWVCSRTSMTDAYIDRIWSDIVCGVYGLEGRTFSREGTHRVLVGLLAWFRELPVELYHPERMDVMYGNFTFEAGRSGSRTIYYQQDGIRYSLTSGILFPVDGNPGDPASYLVQVAARDHLLDLRATNAEYTTAVLVEREDP